MHSILTYTKEKLIVNSMIALDISNSLYIYTMFETTVIKQQHILLRTSILNIILSYSETLKRVDRN